MSTRVLGAQKEVWNYREEATDIEDHETHEQPGQALFHSAISHIPVFVDF